MGLDEFNAVTKMSQRRSKIEICKTYHTATSCRAIKFRQNQTSYSNNLGFNIKPNNISKKLSMKKK